MTDFDPSKVVYQGFIEKLGGNVHNWKRRYFAICHRTLSYFKDKDFKEKLGTIPLIDATITCEPPTDGPGFYFKVVLPAGTAGAERTDYLLRISTEEERTTWITYLKKSTRITVFNKPLQTALKVNPSEPGLYLPIPYFIVKAVNYLNKNSLDVEGVYRLNGSSSQIETFQEKINNNQDIDFTDTHTTTGLIKLYMRTITNPLLLKSNYLQFSQIMQQPEADQVDLIKPILRSLPISHYIFIHYLFGHLNELLRHEATTQMNQRALSVCIGPSLISSDDSVNAQYGESSIQQWLCTIFFNKYNELFGTNPLLMYGSKGPSEMYRIEHIIPDDYPYSVQAPKGSIVQLLAEDESGWAICVYNEHWGVCHKSQLTVAKSKAEIVKSLSQQTNKWTLSQQEMDFLSSHNPQSLHLYEMLKTKLDALRKKASN